MDEVSAGHIDTWDFPFVLPLMMRGVYGIVAQPNLVSNLGFGPDATHTVEFSEWAERTSYAMDFPLKHPRVVAADATADAFTARGQFSRSCWICRAVCFVWRRMRRSFTNQR